MYIFYTCILFSVNDITSTSANNTTPKFKTKKLSENIQIKRTTSILSENHAYFCLFIQKKQNNENALLS